MDISSSQYNSAGESGWTHYLDHSSLSESYFQIRGGIEDHGGKGARVEEEEEDLSMISDASSGPQHYHEDDGQHYCVNWYPSTSHYTKESEKKKNNNKKAKEYGNNQHPSPLDDTASSPVLNCPKASQKAIKKASFSGNGAVENALDFPPCFSGTKIKIHVLEFSRDRKMMSVLCSRNQMHVLFSKGAPESIISRCTSILCNDDGSIVSLTADIRAELDSRFHSFAGKETLRCLALALKWMPSTQQSLSFDDEKDLTFIGLVGMLDPPRDEVRNAMLSCMTAGIRVIVVTGDNKSTAESLCRKIGAFDQLIDFAEHSYTASEFEELPALQQTIALQRMALFTRVEPSHKRMLVEALQHQNEVVAMTGDGVNDAPALKKADIGIAMGSGTAVAKSASDMVLADDNFASIVAAVAEGRAIYNNTKQFIRYMISSNIGEVVCIFVAAVLGIPDTLAPVQLLWVNLVTDGLPATAIGFNKQDSDVMRAKPRKVNEAVVTGWLFFRYLVIGAYVGLATVAGFIWWFVYSDSGPKLPYTELMNFDTCPTRETTYPCSIFDDRHPSTVSMTVLVVVEMFNALNNLSENQSLLVIPPWSNLWLVASIILTMLLHMLILYVHPLSVLFSVTPLSWTDWTVVLYLSLPVIVIDEVLKFFSRNPIGLRFRLWFRRSDLLPKKELRDK
ncbi:Calcium-transporting ATPase 3, endoplasmic reticulum-type [Glycine soja]|nr:Calcium-transporting ATPase 3, endoplasmic reticulum-type [Glycine soja]